jgi:hypothetical protein
VISPAERDPLIRGGVKPAAAMLCSISRLLKKSVALADEA